MNVGGVPWVKQTDPTLVHGFRNVLIICAVIVMLLLAGFGVVPLYTYLVTRHKHQAVKAKWLSSKRSVRYGGSLRYPAYLRLWVHLVAVRLFWVSRSSAILAPGSLSLYLEFQTSLSAIYQVQVHCSALPREPIIQSIPLRWSPRQAVCLQICSWSYEVICLFQIWWS